MGGSAKAENKNKFISTDEDTKQRTHQEQRDSQLEKFSKTDTTSSSSSGSDRLVIDQAGIDRTIAQILGSGDGLAAIMSGEQGAGLYNSTVAQSQATDLATSVVGEIARLTAERKTSNTQAGSNTSVGEGTKEGLSVLDSATDTRRKLRSREHEINASVEGSFGVPTK